MKLLFDSFPILIFYIIFKIAGIYMATGFFLGASILQMSYQWYKHRCFERIQIIVFCLGLIFGSATLLLHNPLFIKWKPTVIYWAVGLLILGSQWFGAKPIFQRIFETQTKLPNLIWSRLNLSWGLFFLFMGALNLYVVYHFSTNTWVNFKLFGMLGITIVFMFIQALYMSKYAQDKGENHEAN